MLKGIFPPITTPFIDDEVAYDRLSENIGKWNKTGINGYVALGSNGESVYLTREEKLKVIETVRDCTSKDKKLIAGTGSDSIKETLFLTNSAAKIGADAALVITPSFYKDQLKHQTMINYYSTVADRADIPVIIYNVPKFTGVNLEADTVAELSGHSNIIGIKNSSENTAHLEAIINNTPKSFLTFVGTGSILLTGLCLSAAGGIIALANIAPQECAEIQRLYESGDLKDSLILQNNLLELNKAVTSKYGTAGLKAALDLLGYYGGLPRLPQNGLNPEESDNLKQVLIRAGLLK